MSSDEENALTNEIADDAADPPITEEDYQKMLRQHRERRTMKKVCSHLVCFKCGRDCGSIVSRLTWT